MSPKYIQTLNSHYDLTLVIILTESSRRTALLLLEDTVEIAYIIESAFVTDVSHAVGTVHQLSGSMSQAYIYDIVRYRLSCLCAKVSAEGCRSHLGYVRECLQAYLLLVMHVYVFLHLSHPHTLRSFLHIGKGTAGQEMIILLERKFIQNLQEFEHTVKTWLGLSDGGYLTVQFHDGIQFECHSPFGIVKESSEAAQLIFGQKLLSQQVGWKLYGNLMYGMTLAVILVPGMFETT